MDSSPKKIATPEVIELPDKLPGPKVLSDVRDVLAQFRLKPWQAFSLAVVLVGIGVGGTYLFMRERLALAAERLVTKDELAAVFRAKAEQLDRASERLSTLTDAQVRIRVARFVEPLQVFAGDVERRSMERYRRESVDPKATEEQKRAAWLTSVAQYQREWITENDEYTRRFVAEGLALRDELLLRLRRHGIPFSPSVPVEFYEGANTITMKHIAAELEVMAKKLPVD